MNKKYSDANEQQERQKLGHRDHSDGTGALADAANVDQYEETINRKHHDNPHSGTSEERHHQGDRVCQYVHDSSHCAERCEKIKHTCKESHVAPERDFDVRVKTAG